MQMAVFGPSTTAIPSGMLLVIEDRRCLISSWFPRAPHRPVLARHLPMPGARCAGAQSLSLRRSSGTAAWGVRSIGAQ